MRVTIEEYRQLRSIARQIGGSNPTTRRRCENYWLNKIRSKAVKREPSVRRSFGKKPGVISRFASAVKQFLSGMFGG